jgi:sugar phosphate isomerase/epimerase
MEQSFAIVDALGLTTILAVAGFDENTVPLTAQIDGFGKLCDRAKAQGIWVDLEFMPHWGLRDLAAAWAIVSKVARDNCGILVDTWHFAKGNPDFDLLRSLPGKYFVGVQVADAMKRQRGATIYEEGSRFRKFPGEGEMPIVEILTIIREKGYLRYIGPEVFSDEADAMSAEAAGKKSGDTMRNVMKASGIPIAARKVA